MLTTRKTWATVGISIGIIGAFYLQKVTTAQSGETSAAARIAEESMGILLIDRTTWRVSRTDGSMSGLDEMNTVEKCRERERAVFAAERPDEYRQQIPPKTPEQLAIEEQAAFTILFPTEAAAIIDAQRTPEQRREREQALWNIRNPGVSR